MTRLGDAAYRLILRAFPSAFRRRHGANMIEQFSHQRRAVRGRPLQAAILWLRAVSDGLRHGLALRIVGTDPIKALRIE